MGRAGGRARRRRFVAASLVVAMATGVVGAGCSGSGDEPGADAAPAFEAEEYTGADFYAPPDPLPDVDHGTLLRYQPLPELEVEGGVAFRVMYASVSVPGEAIAVTGIVAVPTAEAPDEGRKLVTIAHGTTGLADECAPSRLGGAAEASLAAARFVEEGYTVALSDYEGLGTPGRHPYLVGESEGRSVLDAATAARDIPDADVGDRYAIIGYSQGGHGALFAGEMAEEWGPDLELVGTVSGAPATELPAIMTAAGGGPIAGFGFMIVAGLEASYPDADLTTLLTPAGIDTLPVTEVGCAGEVIPAVASRSAEGLFQSDYLTAQPWADLLVENTPGYTTTETPLLILHSAADDLVPVGLSQALFDRLCDEGQLVERRVYDQGKGHLPAAVDAYVDGTAWIDGLMTGEAEAISTCP
jgi:predicted esterase